MGWHVATDDLEGLPLAVLCGSGGLGWSWEVMRDLGGLKMGKGVSSGLVGSRVTMGDCACPLWVLFDLGGRK
jgi:hypothetical protein